MCVHDVFRVGTLLEVRGQSVELVPSFHLSRVPGTEPRLPSTQVAQLAWWIPPVLFSHRAILLAQETFPPPNNFFFSIFFALHYIPLVPLAAAKPLSTVKNHSLTCNWRKWTACRTGQKPKNRGTHLWTEGSSCYVGWGDGVCMYTHFGKCVCESHPEESDTSENC